MVGSGLDRDPAGCEGIILYPISSKSSGSDRIRWIHNTDKNHIALNGAHYFCVNNLIPREVKNCL